MNVELRQLLWLASADQQKQILATFIREQLTDFLHISSLTDFNSHSLPELITDSLSAIDFKIRLENSLGCKLRSTVLLDYPRLDTLVNYLVDEALQITPSRENNESTELHQFEKEGNDEWTGLTTETLESFSEDELAQLLAEELNRVSVGRSE